MKKILLILLISVLLTGCSNVEDEEIKESKLDTTKEYKMSEIEKELVKANDFIEDSMKDLTTDEIENQREVIIEEAYSDIKFQNKTLTVRGKFHETVSYGIDDVALEISSVKNDSDYDEDDNPKLKCIMKNCPEIMFLKENENVLVEGKFSYGYLYDCELISPSVEIPDFENNVDSIVEELNDSFSLGDEVIGLYYGEVRDIYGEVEEVFDISKNDKKKEVVDRFSLEGILELEIEYSDCLILVKGEDDDSLIFAFCDNKDIQKDDKIVIRNEVKAQFSKDDEWVIYTDDLMALYYIYN